MPYANIPSATVTFLDGAFKVNTTSAQPIVLILGSAKSGKSYELFRVGPVSEAEHEFGADSELLKGLHEAVGQGSDNVALMRIGGRQGNVTITQATPDATLFIEPEDRDAEILERFNLVLTAEDAGTQRILIWDNVDEEWVYDSDEIEVINGDRIRVVVDDDFLDWEVGDFTDPEASPTLAALVSGDFTAVNGSGSTIDDVTQVAGDDGTAMSLVERYAALATAYFNLDFRDADFVVPKNAFIDSPNVADGFTAVYDGHTVPTAGSDGDVLGRVWHYIYRNKLYTYFIESDAVLSANASKQFGATTAGRITFNALDAGPAGEAVGIKFVDDGTAGAETISISGSVVTIHFESGVSTVAQVKTAYDASLADTTLAGSVATVAGTLTIPADQLDVTVYLVLDGALTHEDLTGDDIPTAVTLRWQESVAAEFRECNFAHQLATFCHYTSYQWRVMMGVISFLAPPAFDRLSVADWIGNLPTYTTKGQQLVIDTSGDNGFGVLGNKFLAGKAGYRNDQVTEGDGGDGLAYGGFVLTNGSSLPTADQEFAYGVSDTDEATDTGGKPVDIGKFIWVTYDYPKLRNGFNGGSTYRGDIAASFAGRQAVTPVNREAIGSEFGRMVKASDSPRIQAPLINDLASIRAVGLRREEGVGYVLVSVHTAAHPDSDYTRGSTMRSVAFLANGLRAIARTYQGKSFDPLVINSMSASFSGYMQAQQVLGLHQGAKVTIAYTRSSRIMGRAMAKVRLIPPFSIESIDFEFSLAAEESEL